MMLFYYLKTEQHRSFLYSDNMHNIQSQIIYLAPSLIRITEKFKAIAKRFNCIQFFDAFLLIGHAVLNIYQTFSLKF